MRSRLTLVADRELPAHLIADTEQALVHVGWLGIRRRVVDSARLHAVHFDGVIPPATLTHAGHDHAQVLVDLRTGWVALGVACAVQDDPPSRLAEPTVDPALAAVAVIERLSGHAASGEDFRAGLAVAAARLLAGPDVPPAGMVAELGDAVALVDSLGVDSLGAGANLHAVVRAAVALLGLDDALPAPPAH